MKASKKPTKPTFSNNGKPEAFAYAYDDLRVILIEPGTFSTFSTGDRETFSAVTFPDYSDRAKYVPIDEVPLYRDDFQVIGFLTDWRLLLQKILLTNDENEPIDPGNLDSIAAQEILALRKGLPSNPRIFSQIRQFVYSDIFVCSCVCNLMNVEQVVSGISRRFGHSLEVALPDDLLGIKNQLPDCITHPTFRAEFEDDELLITESECAAFWYM